MFYRNGTITRNNQLANSITMKKLLCICLSVAVMGMLSAQETKWLNLQGEVRVDYQREYLDGDAVKSNSGFKGKYVNFQLSGEISDAFSIRTGSG